MRNLINEAFGTWLAPTQDCHPTFAPCRKSSQDPRATCLVIPITNTSSSCTFSCPGSRRQTNSKMLTKIQPTKSYIQSNRFL